MAARRCRTSKGRFKKCGSGGARKAGKRKTKCLRRGKHNKCLKRAK